MNKKIGRNDKCFCMSGKKYKNCCENKKERDKFLLDSLNSTYIDLGYVINTLELDGPLVNFLNDNIPKLKSELMVCINPKLDARMRSCGFEGGPNIIIVKSVPIAKEDNFDFAHEIGHIILAQEGYPLSRIIDADPRKVYLGTILTNTIIDPLVNEIVLKYNFDFESYISKAKRVQIPIFENSAKENQLHPYNRHFLKCLLIEKLNEWKLFDIKQENDYEIICKEKYPKIYEEAIQFINYSEEYGYDSPEKVRILLNKLLEDNDMKNIISIL
ncbi:YecA family protein [Clostridium disporicum]|uniref:YecA family protein n=1 Tax=Clostridium disporicum TaxID=84024 RepID=UPI0034A58B0C